MHWVVITVNKVSKPPTLTLGLSYIYVSTPLMFFEIGSDFRPNFTREAVKNQPGVRLTGSWTNALTFFLYHVNLTLESLMCVPL